MTKYVEELKQRAIKGFERLVGIPEESVKDMIIDGNMLTFKVHNIDAYPQIAANIGAGTSTPTGGFGSYKRLADGITLTREDDDGKGAERIMKGFARVEEQILRKDAANQL